MRESLNRSEWAPCRTRPSSGPLGKRWRKAEFRRRLGGPPSLKGLEPGSRPSSGRATGWNKRAESRRGAMLRGKRKKRKRPKGGGRSAPAVQGLRGLRGLLSGVIPWKSKDPTATIITCALEGKSVYSLWQDKNPSGSSPTPATRPP